MPRYKFSELAYNINQKKMPEPGDEEMYIGLEHLDSGSLSVKRWGSDVPITGEKLVMRKGDILFGRRNTYLRRAAIAPHNGIFSAHGMIFRPNTEVMDPDYFPFFIASDYFMNAAIRISVGSLSPTVNWKTLKDLEFDVPDLDSQRKSAELLTAANELKESYEKLLVKTDELVKSQFIEMFGSVQDNRRNLPVMTIGEFANCYPGATPSTKHKEYWEGGTIPWMSSGEVHKGHVYDTDQKITQQGYDNASTRMVPAHSIVIALAGQGKTRGTVAINEIELCTNQSLCCIIPDNSIVLTDYLYNNLIGRYEELRNMSAIPGGRGGLSLTIINKIPVVIPPIDEQRRYVALAEQSDKSKFDCSNRNLSRCLLEKVTLKKQSAK